MNAFQMLTNPSNDTGHLYNPVSSAVALSTGLSIIYIIQLFLRPIPTLLLVDHPLSLRECHTSILASFVIHIRP